MTEDERDQLTSLDVVRLISLVSFLKAADGLKPQAIYGPLRLTNREFEGLIRAQNFENTAAYEGLYQQAFKHVSSNTGLVDRYPELIPQLKVLFDGRFKCEFVYTSDETVTELVKLHNRLAGYFLEHAKNKASDEEKALRNYEGHYQVIRYATSSDQHPDPRIIVAYASITPVEPPKFSFPEFTLKFPQRRKVPVEDLPRTKGILMPLEKHVFMVGQDKESDYPAIVVFPYQRTRVHSINGLVFRRHIEGHIIAARCHFIRHDPKEGGKPLEQLLDEVSIYDETDPFIQDNFTNELSQILNKVPLVGKGTLRLVP